MAYIADVTPAEKRASSYGLVGVAFGIGFVFGPAFGGLLGHIDPRLPFWAAAGAQSCQRRVRLAGAAGVAARRTPPSVRLAPRQPGSAR